MKSPYRHGSRKDTPAKDASSSAPRSGDGGTAPRREYSPVQGERPAPRFKPKADFGNRDYAKGPKDDSAQEFGARDFGARVKDKSRFAPKPKKEKYQAPEDCDVLYGIHTVREALLNPKRRHRRLLVTENALVRLSEDLALPLAPDVVKADAINPLLPEDAVHQGVYLETERLPLLRLEKLPQDKVIVALRIMWERSCDPRQPSMSGRFSPRSAIRRISPACSPRPLPARWSMCRWWA